MQIRAIHLIQFTDKICKPGDTTDVSKKEAAFLIERGAAEEVNDTEALPPAESKE